MAEFRRRRRRPKVCSFCANKIEYVDYKNVEQLKKFLTERGKILPHRVTGNVPNTRDNLLGPLKGPGSWRFCRSR